MKWVLKGKKKKYTFKRFFKGFNYAFSGIISAIKTEPNIIIEMIIGIIALLLGVYLKISPLEFVIVILTVGLVISMELINTSIEYTVDMAMPEVHPLAKSAKDVAAGAVLFASIC